MNVTRVISTLALASMLCSILAANSGVQILCSHDGGYGHLVELDDHTTESSSACGHKHAHEDDHHVDHPSCVDVEVPDSELEDLSSNSDRSVVKAPELYLDLFESVGSLSDPRVDAADLRPKDTPTLESESRQFAKTVQIRC